MRPTVAVIAAALATVSAGELALRSGDNGKAQRRAHSLQRQQAAIEARLREVSSQLESLSSGTCALPDGDGLVASLALSLGVPVETMSLTLLLSGIVFLWHKGEAILHALGVLLVAAGLTLFALARRASRNLTARMAALGTNAALVAIAFSSAPLESTWPLVACAALSTALVLVVPSMRSAPARAGAGEVRAPRAVTQSRYRRRGKRGLRPKQLLGALEEVWQLHTDGFLLHAAELLAEVEDVVAQAGGAGGAGGGSGGGGGGHAHEDASAAAAAQLQAHAGRAAEIKEREGASLSALSAFEGGADEGWALVGEFKGSRTYYSAHGGDSGAMLCRTEGVIEGVPLRNVLAVWREVQLFDRWIPAVVEARVLRWIGPSEFLVWFDAWLGVLYRDIVAHGYGVDLLHQGQLLIMCASVERDAFPDDPIPPPPRLFAGRRALIREMRVLLEPLAADRTRCTLVINMDLRVPLPQSMVDMVTRNVIGVFFYLQARAAKKISRGDGPHLQAIGKDPAFYQGWLQPKLERYFARQHTASAA